MIRFFGDRTSPPPGPPSVTWALDLFRARPGAGRPPRLSVVVGVGSIALGLAGMIGVSTRTPILVQLVHGTTPIRFNTALCFVAAGAGLVGAARGRRVVVWASAVVLATVAGLTAIEYVLGLDLRIDELLVHDHRLTADQLPRMAPNTAAAFLVAALASGLTGIKRQRRWMPATEGLAAMFVGSVGFVALVGYVVGASSAYRWGETEPIAVVTSFGLVLLSVGLVERAWRGSASLEEGTPRWLPWAIGIAFVVSNFALVESIANVRMRAGDTIRDIEGAREILLAVAVLSAGLLGLATHFALAARRQASRVRREEAFNHQLLDAMDDLRSGVAIVEGMRIVFANEGFCRISGYRPDELLALSSKAELVVPERRDELADVWERLYEEPERVQTYETAILAKDGTRIELEIATKIMPDDPSSRILLMRDVTDRKRAEDELRVEHDRFRRLVDSNVVGIVIADATGRIFTANDYYLNVIGYTRDELAVDEVDWRTITPPEWMPADEQALRELRERGTCTPYEKEYVRRDGSRVPVLIADAMLPGPEERIAAVVLDVTEQKRAKELLRRSELRLVGAQEDERRRIASDIHDDPVQKMTAVSIRLDILRRRISDPEAQESLDALGDIVRLAISRLRQLLFELRPPAVERGGLADTIRRLGEEMEQAGVELHVEDRLTVEPPSGSSVNAYRIVQEALANVRKHARATRAAVVLEMKERSLFIRIEDDGIGVTPERLADPDFGHIGIDGMRERAELVGGWCTIDGRRGGGTTVECLLPVDVLSPALD